MERLQTLVPRAVAALLQQGPISQAKLECAWRISVGDALARASTVRLRDGGTVEVAAADARWQRELSRSRDMILARLRTLLGSGQVTRLQIGR